jgi:hypothetical protein
VRCAWMVLGLVHGRCCAVSYGALCSGRLVHGCVVAACVWTIAWRRSIVEWHAMSGDCVAGDGAAIRAGLAACVSCAVSLRGCRAAAARLCRDDPAVPYSCPYVSL